ncbi:MAG: ATP-binding cassette domain-containing protein [Pseudomonadota bacterium]
MLAVRLQGRAYDGFNLNVDFSVAKGTCTGIFGLSGSGKSTLLRCIAGLKAVDGEIQCDGTPWRHNGINLPPHQRRAAMVFQSPSLLPHKSVDENIAQAASYASTKTNALSIDTLIEQFGLAGLRQRTAASLSGGQQQRAAIARAVAAQPPVLLLDEPLTGLDADARNQILQVLMRLQQSGQTMIFVSHSATAHALLANKLLVLEAGAQSLYGDTQSVFENAAAPAALRKQAGVMLRGATVLDNDGGLASVQYQTLRFQVACAAEVGASLNLRIRADDVSLSTGESAPSSIMNAVPATVVGIACTDANPMAMVTLDCGGQRLLSRVTRRALERLTLEVGDPVVAQIKSAAIDVFTVTELSEQ